MYSFYSKLSFLQQNVEEGDFLLTFVKFSFKDWSSSILKEMLLVVKESQNASLTLNRILPYFLA